MPKDASGKIILETADLRDTWEALEKCKDAGLTQSTDMSNFNSKQLGMVLNKPGLKYKPVCNQIFDFELTPEDTEAIDALNRNFLLFKFHFAVGHPYYPFAEEY